MAKHKQAHGDRGRRAWIVIIVICCVLAPVFIWNLLQHRYLTLVKTPDDVQPTKQETDTIDLASVPDGLIFGTSTLQPKFRVPVPSDITLDDIDFRIDDSRNILEDPFLSDLVDVAVQKGNLSIRPQFMLFPGAHTFVATISEGYLERVIRKQLILAYLDDFSSDEGLRYLWGTDDDWSITDSGKLKTSVSDEVTVSDISFRMNLPENILFEFDFIPLSKAVNISVFFSEGVSIFIGDGDDRTVRLVRSEVSEAGKVRDLVWAETVLPFRLQKRQEYRARITRIGESYSLSVSDKPGVPIEGLHPVLTITHEDPAKRLSPRFHTLGFAVWRGEKEKTIGAIFDNLLIYQPSNLPAAEETLLENLVLGTPASN